MARCASCTACRRRPRPRSGCPTAALALSPACSSSITESRADPSPSGWRLALSAFLSNSPDGHRDHGRPGVGLGRAQRRRLVLDLAQPGHHVEYVEQWCRSLPGGGRGERTPPGGPATTSVQSKPERLRPTVASLALLASAPGGNVARAHWVRELVRTRHYQSRVTTDTPCAAPYSRDRGLPVDPDQRGVEVGPRRLTTRPAR